MRRFAALYRDLDASGGTAARVATLAAYFAAAEPAEAAWALQVLLGKQGRRLITARRLREICLQGSGLPEWLFDDCYRQVGDSAETIALLWQQHADPSGPDPSPEPLQPLDLWMETLLPRLAALEGEAQAEAVQALWRQLPPDELLVCNKLLTGGFRVGVGEGLVIRALARHAGLEEAQLRHRLMGGFTASAAAFEQLLQGEDDGTAALSRPYPFFLASPLDARRLEDSDPGDWQLEWKWDGIRGQLIRRGGESFLWSRGEELINAAFPELLTLADLLADGTVLDGEILVWPPQAPHPAPFAALQRRLGRKAPSARLRQSHPATFVAYDLLEAEGHDRRPHPLSQRRAALDTLIQALSQAASAPEAGLLRLSPVLALPSWEALEALRNNARAVGAEGLMLKALASPYLAGRRRGAWWKHKLEPLRLDAVLLYAQAGSGRRANLYTDYTFGLWNGEGQLVSFAKAYSGLTDAEIEELDRWIRRHTTERFGPVRAVAPQQVFELAFEGLQPSRRHRSGIAVRFPRISRWRKEKPASEADTLDAALALLDPPS
jgi:DNA ligase-1